MVDINIDEMSEDIINQLYPNKPKSLKDIKKYDLTDEQEDDFDITYRTPAKVSDNERLTINDLAGTGALPQNYNIVDNPDKYMDDLLETHPRRKMKVKLPGVYNKPVNIPDEDITNPQKIPSRGLYSALFDEIAIQQPKSQKTDDINEFYNDLMHEDTHQRQRRIELNKPVSRVKTEPSVELFEKLFYDKQIPKDFKARLKPESMPFEKREQMLKDRKETIKEIEDESLAEQLAYYGDYFLRDSYVNPKTKTEKVLNRLKFENAPIWGMDI
jgi:hypothetical protein